MYVAVVTGRCETNQAIFLNFRLLRIVILPCYKNVYTVFFISHLVECQPHEFKCNTVHACIDYGFVCDREQLCMDGSDDEDCGMQD